MIQMEELIDRLLLSARKCTEAVEEREGTLLDKAMFLSNSAEVRTGVLWSFGGRKLREL